MQQTRSRNYRQAGAVSLFVVIFAMLLLTVVTVSFLRLMMADLRQASDTDLSRSAYDSAQAGVEDAKRALLRYQTYCAGVSSTDCDALADQLSSDVCNEAVRIGGVVPGGSGEVPVQTSSASVNAASFDQAYTCVTMDLNTDDVVGPLVPGTSEFVPLKAVAPFNQVTISWFDQRDLSSPSEPVDLESQTSPMDLDRDWPTSRPPVLRAQLMQTGANFSLDSFDAITASSESNAMTLFLHPTTNGNTATSFSGRDMRSNGGGDAPDADRPEDSPLATRCSPTVAAGAYACSITLDLPDPVGGGDRQGYLRLTSFYRGTQFKVELSNSGSPVQFKAVQPAIDATGRANDLFRRVETRVQMTANLPMPEAAVDVTTEFCKDFTVTDTRMIPQTCTYN